MEEFEIKKNKIEIPKTSYYFYHVRNETGDPIVDREIFYSVVVADCPWCGKTNQDVGESGHIFTCDCGKQFEIGELDDSKSLG